MLTGMVQEIDDAPLRNFERWPILETWIWPNVEVTGSFEGEINYLRNWLTDRLKWMDDNMPSISQAVRGPYSRARLEVYPNPYQDKVNIRIQRDFSQSIRFEVFDIQGRKLVNLPIDSQEGYDLFYQWDGNTSEGNSVSPGVYLYRILSGEQLLKNGKLVKQ